MVNATTALKSDLETKTYPWETKPFVVAELSGNHQQSYAQALALIDAAATAGADGVKFQTYTAETMTLPCDHPPFVIQDPTSLWNGRQLFALYEAAHTPWDWLPGLFEHARQRGLVAFSSPFDQTALTALEAVDCPFYKIASFELTDIPLLMAVGALGKPVILSTGMGTEAEIQTALSTLCAAGCTLVVLLKCTSTYPAPVTQMNLRSIPLLQARFGCPVGLSDHSLGLGASVAAVALGACMIEKHLVLDRNSNAIDAGFSTEPHEFSQLVQAVHQAWQAMGHAQLGPTEAEQNSSLHHRRSIYACQAIECGEPFTTDNVRVIRPGLGLAPIHYAELLGKIARQAYQPGDPIQAMPV
jgi:pseudaminic acid synthase